MNHEIPPREPEDEIEGHNEVSLNPHEEPRAMPPRSAEEVASAEEKAEKVRDSLPKKEEAEHDAHAGEEKKTLFARALGHGLVWYPTTTLGMGFAGLLNLFVKGFNSTLEKLGAKTSAGGGGHKKDDSHGGDHGHGGGGGHH